MSEHKIVVSKFGGSSMKNAEAIRRSACIAREHQATIVVVSATYGTTNNLLKLMDLAKNSDWDQVATLIEEIKTNHIGIAKDLNCTEILSDQLNSLFLELETLLKGVNLLKDAPPKVGDRLLSLGERMSSLLMTYALSEIYQNREKTVENFDARKVVRTTAQFGKGTPQIDSIRELCSKFLNDGKYGKKVFVTQGFIGATEEGETTTLGRGGSDYSAALIAEGIGADLLEIWTDVAGIATTDPRICSEARPIHEITFKEAAELAIFGAKILHPTTLAPVQRESIPVFVGSSYEPDAPGTWIRTQSQHQPLVRAMAQRKGQSLLTLTTPKMLNSYGFLAKIFQVFEKHQVSVDAITTSEISLSVTVDASILDHKELFDDLNEIGTIQTEKNLSLVSLIGNNINHTPGLGQKIFTSLQNGDDPINVRMICFGASRHNFCIVVREEDSEKAIKRFHKNFIEQENMI